MKTGWYAYQHQNSGRKIIFYIGAPWPGEENAILAPNESGFPALYGWVAPSGEIKHAGGWRDALLDEAIALAVESPEFARMGYAGDFSSADKLKRR